VASNVLLIVPSFAEIRQVVLIKKEEECVDSRMTSRTASFLRIRGKAEGKLGVGLCEYDRAMYSHTRHIIKKKLNSMVCVRERTVPTERPPLVGEVIANLCG
jgi:hypothetical protein